MRNAATALACAWVFMLASCATADVSKLQEATSPAKFAETSIVMGAAQGFATVDDLKKITYCEDGTSRHLPTTNAQLLKECDAFYDLGVKGAIKMNVKDVSCVETSNPEKGLHIVNCVLTAQHPKYMPEPTKMEKKIAIREIDGELKQAFYPSGEVVEPGNPSEADAANVGKANDSKGKTKAKTSKSGKKKAKAATKK